MNNILSGHKIVAATLPMAQTQILHQLYYILPTEACLKPGALVRDTRKSWNQLHGYIYLSQSNKIHNLQTINRNICGLSDADAKGRDDIFHPILCVGCNFLGRFFIPASGTQVLIYAHFIFSLKRTDICVFIGLRYLNLFFQCCIPLRQVIKPLLSNALYNFVWGKNCRKIYPHVKATNV